MKLSTERSVDLSARGVGPRRLQREAIRLADRNESAVVGNTASVERRCPWKKINLVQEPKQQNICIMTPAQDPKQKHTQIYELCDFHVFLAFSDISN